MQFMFRWTQIHNDKPKTRLISRNENIIAIQTDKTVSSTVQGLVFKKRSPKHLTSIKQKGSSVYKHILILTE
jgi:hypothetical protein